MSKRSVLFWALLLLLSGRPAGADILLLVHGYASDAGTWELSGINSALQLRGWPRAGVLWPGREPMSPAHDAAGPRNLSYAVNLPAEAPLLVQAGYLRSVLGVLRRHHPADKLVLVGHSAGGVVARLAVLGDNPFRVDRLITIASPHLGTARAAQGLDVVDSQPFFCPGPGIDFLKSVVGGSGYDYLRHSRAVLLDLLPAGSGNALDWLNRQPHPDIRYDAVVRGAAYGAGDEMVPAYSQDMNNVPALRGRAAVVLTPASHGLNPRDGVLLAGMLEN